MNNNALFAEQCNIVAAVPVDLAGAAGIATPAVNLRHYDRATLVFIKGIGAGAEDPVITITEGTGINAGALVGGQNLPVITRVDTKLGVGSVPQVYSQVNQAAAATFTSALLGDSQGVVAIDIRPDQLTDGFSCVRAAIADVGVTAQLGTLFWLLWSANHAPTLNAEANT